jgi:RNA polymerase sigma factor (sigma-70 family)
MQAEEGAQRRAHFEGIALPHAPRLRAAAWRWCGQRAAADDAVQETFLRAYRTFDSFRPGTNARAWLFTILYSVCANEHARNRVRRWVPLDETPESHLLRESERRDDPRDFEPNKPSESFRSFRSPFAVRSRWSTSTSFPTSKPLSRSAAPLGHCVHGSRAGGVRSRKSWRTSPRD